MSVSQYDYLKPQIVALLQHFSVGTQAFVKENQKLEPQEVFVVLYEAALATLGQVLGSAFAENPELNQIDMYNKALHSLKMHTENYHKLFLTQLEMKNGRNE